MAAFFLLTFFMESYLLRFKRQRAQLAQKYPPTHFMESYLLRFKRQRAQRAQKYPQRTEGTAPREPT